MNSMPRNSDEMAKAMSAVGTAWASGVPAMTRSSACSTRSIHGSMPASTLSRSSSEDSEPARSWVSTVVLPRLVSSSWISRPTAMRRARESTSARRSA